GSALTGHTDVAAVGGAVALLSTALNWWRLGRRPDQTSWGSVRLELRWLGPWTVARFMAGIAGITLVVSGAAWPAAVLLGASEVVGRWLFFVTVVPYNMPGAFWRGTAGSPR